MMSYYVRSTSTLYSLLKAYIRLETLFVVVFLLSMSGGLTLYFCSNCFFHFGISFVPPSL